MKRGNSVCVLLLFVLGLLLNPCRMTAAGLEADMVILNGKILTADSLDPDQFSIAQAAAVYGGKFIAVGNNAEVLEYAGQGTRRIDLAGRTVLPGLVETHDHIYSYGSHFFPEGHQLVGRTDPPATWTSRDDFLAQIRTLALSKQPGEWIVTSTRGGPMGIIMELQKGEVTRFDLDEVAPNNPVYLHWNVSVEGLANTKALDQLLERYPNIVGLKRDANGVPTGRMTGVANLTMWYEFWPQVPPEDLGPYYKLEMEEIAAQGLTTVSTRLQPNHLAAYSWLHARDELPVRMAYSLETAARSETTEATMSRLVGLQGGTGKGMWGAGDDKLWMIGISPISADSVTGIAGSCVTKPWPREAPNFPMWLHQLYGPYGVCRLTSPDYHDIDVLRAAAKYGFRISALHISGDGGIDQLLDAVEELGEQYPDIAERRWAVDHCQIVREEQIRRAKKFNLMFSCGPTFLYDGEKGSVGAFGILYGEEEAGNAVIPFRSLIDNGVPAVMELDRHGFHPFLALQVVINRKDVNGKVWGSGQRISRREALYTYTRWSSEYLLREDHLGSVESKKAADFTVLNRDYLAVPEDEIGRIDPVLTVMGGKITYTQPEFAASNNLPLVGYQGDRSWWKRGTPEDATRGRGPQ